MFAIYGGVCRYLASYTKVDGCYGKLILIVRKFFFSSSYSIVCSYIILSTVCFVVAGSKFTIF